MTLLQIQSVQAYAGAGYGNVYAPSDGVYDETEELAPVIWLYAFTEYPEEQIVEAPAEFSSPVYYMSGA